MVCSLFGRVEGNWWLWNLHVCRNRCGAFGNKTQGADEISIHNASSYKVVSKSSKRERVDVNLSVWVELTDRCSASLRSKWTQGKARPIYKDDAPQTAKLGDLRVIIMIISTLTTISTHFRQRHHLSMVSKFISLSWALPSRYERKKGIELLNKEAKAAVYTIRVLHWAASI